MAKFFRYSLATLCFAASVGCLALWGWSASRIDLLIAPNPFGLEPAIVVEVADGVVDMRQMHNGDARMWSIRSGSLSNRDEFGLSPVSERQFGLNLRWVVFPLWYPALIFALAGVGVLRISRRFSIRSTLVATTFVAALIGMAVIL